MAYENVISDAVLSETQVKLKDCDYCTSGDQSKALDGSTSTYAFGRAVPDFGDYGPDQSGIRHTWTYTFSSPVVKAKNLAIYAACGAVGASNQLINSDVHNGSVYLRYTIVSDEGTNLVYASSTGDDAQRSYSYSSATEYNNVTQIIVEAQAYNFFYSYGYADCRLFEISLDGIYYVDKNIRFRSGGATIKAACHVDLSSNPKLRMRSGGETVGLVLVDVADDNASKLRIKTSAGIKAIAQLS